MDSKTEGFSFLMDPILFSLDFVEIRWYSLMYFIGFGLVLFFVLREFKKQKKEKAFLDSIENILFWMFLFGLLGGRLGYVLFYDFSFFSLYPERVFLPFDTEGHYAGISGMSFHGGMIGASSALFFLCWKEKMSLWKISDIIVLYFPIAIFFGRIGNFLNKELYGRQTNVSWGVDFGDGVLRHPSQLYEAFFEGIILCIVLFFLKKKIKKDGMLTVIFFIGYGIFRFFIEFFREPDEQIGYIFFHVLTLGQILSVVMVSIGFSFFFYIKRKEKTSLKLIKKESS